jgi:DNA repair protein RecO (recombination protein O)
VSIPADSTRVQLAPVWVLSRRPYRESSLLLEVMAWGHGRIGLVARASRGSRRSQAPALLQRYRMSWSRRGELGTVTAFESDGPPAALQGETILWAWYLNELLLRALPRDDEHPPLYSAYERALAELAAGVGESALRRFELALITELGFGLSAAEGALVPGRRYRYEDGVGAIADDEGGYDGAVLAAIETGDFSRPEVCRAARRLFQTQLPHLVGDRPLTTPALLRRLRARAVPNIETGHSGAPDSAP